MKKLFFVFGVSLIFILSGCQNVFTNNPGRTTGSETPAVQENKAVTEQAVGIANPASTNCVEKGGKIEIRKGKQGEYGVCLFEDNRQCEEWALFRGECPVGGVKITGFENEAEIYCAITGGQVEGVDTPVPMCKRIDGTYCNAQSNFDGECPDPHDPNPSTGNIEAL